ncbi:MAG: enolase C-terminal domain-like protein [Chloroflexota bacterium]
MQITGVRFVRVRGTLRYDGPMGEERLVRPTDIYPEFRREGPAVSGLSHSPDGIYPMEALFLHIDTDAEVTGMWGPVSEGVARTVAGSLARILVGEDGLATERIWDKLYRASIHGRKGETMMAISAVDLALWDLKGKFYGAPAYQLIGGPSRDRIRAYASMLGHSIEPTMAAQRALEVVAQGYTAMKWFFRYGPTDGPEGFRKNVELVRTIREAVGPDVEIMFDAWSSWTVPYTQRIAQAVAPYRPWWIEEPVLADMIPQYAELRASVQGVAIAGGEHEYTRWGALALLETKAVHILQMDPTWAGGLSEMLKICALASAYGIPVIPHHGGLASAHLIASQSLTTCPIQEWLIQHGLRGQFFLKHKIEPRDGYIALPSAPGMGMELDESVIASSEEASFG